MPSEDHMKKAMEDVTHMSEALKPLPEDPNRTIPVNEVLLALATAPCMCRIIPADVPSKISELEEAMRAEKVDMDWVDKASGAARNNLTVQWCMPYAHDVLAAAALPAVTNARACATTCVECVQDARRGVPRGLRTVLRQPKDEAIVLSSTCSARPSPESASAPAPASTM